MIASEKQRAGKLLLLLPILLAALVYLFSTTDRGVIDYDEGYYSQAAKNMVESGDWVTPYVNGVRFLEKPPLMYWLTALSFKIFGINEFALRLPTALAVIALVWIVTLIGRRLSGERTALIAGLSTAFSVGTYLFTRETLHDVWLVLFIALAMYSFVEWHQDPMRPRKFAILFYIAVAGAVMCKSLIGIVFPVGIVAIFFLVSREWPKLRTLHIVPGLTIFLVLTVPWHWLAAVRNHGFLDFFFMGEQFLRFFGKREPPVLWELPVITFLALVLVWLFPWTAFLPAAIAEGRKQEDKNRRILLVLCLAWAGFILVFFSVSGRLEHYSFPALPALSLIVADVLGRSERSSILWGFRGLVALAILALVIGIGVCIWFASGNEIHFASTGPTDRLAENDFTILAEMPQPVISNLLKPAAVTVIALAIGFPAAFWFEKRSRRVAAVLCLVSVMIVVFVDAHWSLGICEDLISSKQFAIAVAREARPGDRLIVLDDYESANSLNFYEPLRVEVSGGRAYALVPGMKYPEAPRVVLSDQEFKTAWMSDNRIFALVPKARIGELVPAGIQITSILHRVLVRNH